MPLWRRIARTIAVALLAAAGLGTGGGHYEIVHLDVDGSVLSRGCRRNLVTNVGRQFLHTQGYSTSPGANGLNWVGLSNDTVTETGTSTTLSNEIATSGFSRKQATTINLPTGAGNQTVLKVEFTATGTVSAQKAALFTASSSGTMSHVLAFPQGSVSFAAGQKLLITITITLG